jgi:hypothetical protein
MESARDIFRKSKTGRRFTCKSFFTCNSLIYKEFTSKPFKPKDLGGFSR